MLALAVTLNLILTTSSIPERSGIQLVLWYRMPNSRPGCSTSLRRSVHLLYHQWSDIQKYCWIRPILIAGATLASLHHHQQHPHTVLSWPASSRPVAVPWHDMHPVACRLVACHLRQHACPSTAVADVGWPMADSCCCCLYVGRSKTANGAATAILS